MMPWNRKELIGACTLYLADCTEVMPHLGTVDAIVTDPPYGIFNTSNADKDVRKSSRQQGSGKLKNRALNSADIGWDLAPTRQFFDSARAMSQWQIFWGGNYFELPPARGVLVWDKEQPWPNFSQAELAWTNLDRPAALFRANSGRAEPNKVHPTQKPLSLMSWCLGFVPEAKTILDPFMGSGTTGVACAKSGRTFIGVEREERYFDIACQRIKDAYLQSDMFVPAVPEPAPATQVDMFAKGAGE